MPEDVDIEIGCPTCGWAGTRRDLFAEHLTILKCRSCSTTIESTTAWHFRDEDLILAGDVAAIEACLIDIGKVAKCSVEEKARDEDSGLWRWILPGLSDPWECRIVYHKEQSGIIRLRICAIENIPTLDASERRLKSLAAQNGAEFGGVASMKMVGLLGQLPSLNSVDVWWGVHQMVSIGALSPDLFFSILPRLKAAMQDLIPVVSTIKAERSESSSAQIVDETD